MVWKSRDEFMTAGFSLFFPRNPQRRGTGSCALLKASLFIAINSLCHSNMFMSDPLAISASSETIISRFFATDCYTGTLLKHVTYGSSSESLAVTISSLWRFRLYSPTHRNNSEWRALIHARRQLLAMNASQTGWWRQRRASAVGERRKSESREDKKTTLGVAKRMISW